MRFEIMENPWYCTPTLAHTNTSDEQKKEWARETLEEKEEKSIFSIYAFSIIVDQKC